MFGKHVTISNGEQEVTVFVMCTPSTSRRELVKKAKDLIKQMY